MRRHVTILFLSVLTVPARADVLDEDFDSGFPPPGWTVVDNTGNGGWLLNTDYGRANDTGGSGAAAAIDTDAIGWGAVDTELITPPFLVPPGGTLEFDHSFRWYSGGLIEQADVDLSVNGGAWITLVSYSGADDGYPGGVHRSLNLAAYVGQSVRVRFHYYDANWDWWWQVDNVQVPGTLVFTADTYTISEGTGGTVALTLDAGATGAGRSYLVLGSISGVSPGFPLPGGLVTMPLNWDLFTVMVLKFGNTVAFQDFRGTLDGSGQATATLDSGGPLPIGSLGLTFYFAYGLSGPWDFASNPLGIQIVP